MKSRLALTIAPLLLLAFGVQAHAEGKKHHPSARVALSRHGHTRLAMHARHQGGRHIASRSAVDSDGWSAQAANVSAPPPGMFDGASVHLASFERPLSQDGATIPRQSGIASYYGGRHNGRRTSSGQIFNEHAMTAAHASLPFGTKVLVQVPGTDRSVEVTITDRLFQPHRIIDLSVGAAEKLGIIRAGTALVMLTPED
jgi:rare lipoprotein A